MFAAVLKAIPPVALLGVLGGLVAGAPAGWLGRQLVFDMIERPALVRSIEQRERDACTIRTMDAAKRAEDAEAARWRKIRDDAIAAEEAQAVARDATHQSEIDGLNMRIKDYEQKRRAAGNACTIDDDGERWLREQWGLPVRPAG